MSFFIESNYMVKNNRPTAGAAGTVDQLSGKITGGGEEVSGQI